MCYRAKEFRTLKNLYDSIGDIIINSSQVDPLKIFLKKPPICHIATQGRFS